MQTLARLMVGRYRDSLLARVFFNWAYVVRMDRGNREEATLKALALITGKKEMDMLFRLRGWHAWTQGIVKKRRELARKAFFRYQNQLATKCFLAWSILVHKARQVQDAKLLKALSFISGKEQMLLKLAFAALRRAISAREDEREALVAKALMRMRFGSP